MVRKGAKKSLEEASRLAAAAALHQVLWALRSNFSLRVLVLASNKLGQDFGTERDEVEVRQPLPATYMRDSCTARAVVMG